MTNVQVTALQVGHDGLQIRQVGEQFAVSEAQASDGSTWFTPTDPEVAKRIAALSAERAAERARDQAEADAARATAESAALRAKLLAALQETKP